MADTVAVMNLGQIEQLGHPEVLYDLPQTTFVANFLGPVQPRHRPGHRHRRRQPRRRGARAPRCASPRRGPRSATARSPSACAPRRCASRDHKPDGAGNDVKAHGRRRVASPASPPSTSSTVPSRRHVGGLRAEPRRRPQPPAARRRRVAGVGPGPRVRGPGRRGAARPAPRLPTRTPHSRWPRRDRRRRARRRRRQRTTPTRRRTVAANGRCTAYLLLLPGGLWLLVFFVFPLVQLFTVSLQSRVPRVPRLLLPRRQLRQLRHGAHRVRAALRALAAVCRAGHAASRSSSPTRSPTPWRSRPVAGAT